MRLANKILLATMNPDKYREFSALFKAYPQIELVPAEGLIRNPEKLAFAEVYKTYAENANAKARLANMASHYPALADDSGLEVEALGGRPGVQSHRYAKLAPGAARSSQDQANNELLLSELKGKNDRGAKFVCSLALCIEGILIQATGTLEGTILEQPRGTLGFGYDPLFLPKDCSKTLAEMTEAEKNEISHRARAVNELMAQIKARGIVFAKP